MARKKVENKIKFKNFGIPELEAGRLEGWKRVYKKSYAWLIRNFFKKCGNEYEYWLKDEWQETKKVQENLEENRRN